MNTIANSMNPPTQDQIARRAYELWEQNGRPTGQDTKYWLQAETELMAGSQPRKAENNHNRASTAAILGSNNRSTKRSRTLATK